MVARSRARGCRRSLARIAGSNPAGGMDVCLLSVLCVVSSTESCPVWCVQLSDIDTSAMRRPRPRGLSSHNIGSKGAYPARILCKVQILLMKVYSLPIQYYVHLQKQVYACMHRKLLGACASKTGNVHIKATQRRVRLTIVAVEKE
jgi:hypothetical protein